MHICTRILFEHIDRYMDLYMYPYTHIYNIYIYIYGIKWRYILTQLFFRCLSKINHLYTFLGISREAGLLRYSALGCHSLPHKIIFWGVSLQKILA